MNNCIRCDKLVDEVHTCTPTKQYKDGLIEGLKIALKEMNNYYNKYSSEFSHDDTGGYLITIVENLIRQHCHHCDGNGYIVTQVGVDEYGDAIGETYRCSCT